VFGQVVFARPTPIIFEETPTAPFPKWLRLNWVVANS
jgi:hypothetical protein